MMMVAAKMSKCQPAVASALLMMAIGLLIMAEPVIGGLRGSFLARAPMQDIVARQAQKEMMDEEEEDAERMVLPAGGAAAEDEEAGARRPSDEADEEDDGEDEEDDEDDEALEGEDDQHAPDTEGTLRLIRTAGARADADGDGRLSAEEMLRFAERQRELQRTAHTDEVLKGIDHDADGSVSMDELRVATPQEDQPNVRRQRFDAADGDRDGSLNREELHGYLHPELQAETLELETKARLEGMDANKDNHVGLDEFLTHVKRGDLEGDFSEEDAKADFRAHDADQDGKLSGEELAGFVRGDVLLWAQIEHAMAAGDKNSDGYVHLDEELPHRMDKILDSEFVEDYFLRPVHHEL